ncbi:MAG: hypothetical protein Kow0069_00870 [Promethearchaeota archaeon]
MVVTARDTWHQVYAYYSTYLSHVSPVVAQIRRIVHDLEPEELVIDEVLDIIQEEEEKRPSSKVKVQEEFVAYFRAEVLSKIKSHAKRAVSFADPEDIKLQVIQYLTETHDAMEYLRSFVSIDEEEAENSKLHQLCHALQDVLFPLKRSLEGVIQHLRENVAEWFECQRYLLLPQTYYKESYTHGEVEGISPILHKIIKHATSLFNLDPNYGNLPNKPEYEVPMVKVEELFLPFLDSVASYHQENLNKVVSMFGFQVLFGAFVAPTEEFLKIMEPYGYVIPKREGDETRWIAQFSNETLLLMYLGLSSHRRGFLSRELVNWVAMNFAYVIYLGVVNAFMSEDNFLREVLFDAKMLEKTLPYLMKLLCFPAFLRIDRAKIRDSPQYRKQIYIFLGSHVPCVERLAQEVKKMIMEE